MVQALHVCDRHSEIVAQTIATKRSLGKFCNFHRQVCHNICPYIQDIGSRCHSKPNYLPIEEWHLLCRQAANAEDQQMYQLGLWHGPAIVGNLLDCTNCRLLCVKAELSVPAVTDFGAESWLINCLSQGCAQQT